MHVISEEETGKRIERPSRKSKRTSLLLTVLSFAIGVVLGIVVSRYAKPRAELLVGVVLAGITGCIVGFWLGRARKRGGKAERLFMLAMQEENQGKKRKLMGKIVSKYPNTEWVDKVLDERIKNEIVQAGQGSTKTSEKKVSSDILSENKGEINIWKEAQRLKDERLSIVWKEAQKLRDEGLSIRAIAKRLGVPKSTIHDRTVPSSRPSYTSPRMRTKRPLK